ncbi:ABC transporter substrate-binding protein (plasmid) [Aquamicrobium terrae]
MKKLLLSAGLAVFLAMSHNSAAVADTKITIGVDVDAGTLDPRLARDSTAMRIGDLLFSGLVHLTPSLEAVPDLAESWETPDPTTFIFHLREGLTFSDGSPLTADDVVYTYQALTDPQFGAPQQALYTPIKAVEAVDPRTVKFTLSAPYAPLLSYLDMGIVPKALAGNGADFALKPVGAGPMKLVRWTRGSEMVLAANEHYWGKAPTVTEMTVKIIGDNSARAQAFEAGNLDVIQSPLSPQDVKRLSADDRFGHAIMAGLGITYLNFGVKDPLLSDPAMRRAFAMLVDQETLVRDIYQGVDEVTHSVLLPSSWAYDASISQPKFDPAAAVAAFNQLSWTDSNGDGILDKGGKPLTVTIATHTEDPNRVQAVEYLQAIFEMAGIKAETRISDWASFSTNYVQKGEHQIALLGWLGIVDPDRLLYSQLTTGGGNNWAGYSNPKVDEQLNRGRTETDRAERAKAYQEAARIIAEDVPYYIISAQGYQMFYAKDLPVEKVQANPRGNLRGVIGLND